jgi:hypothetical protein
MPLTPPDRSRYIETLRSRIVEGRTLNPYQFRPVVIPLQVTLGSSRQQGQASFNIPSNQRLLIRQFIPIVVPSVNSAADTLTGNSTTDPTTLVPPTTFAFTGTNEDLLMMKAMNCRIDLGLTSRMYNLFQQMSFPLSDATSWFGGEINMKDTPGIMPQGTTIDLTASLTDLAAAGSDTQYGLAIAGLYVQV